MSWVVFSRAALTAAALGLAIPRVASHWRTRAPAPATSGVDIEVPPE